MGGTAVSTNASPTAGPTRRRHDGRRRETQDRLLAAGLEELRCPPYGELSIRTVADRAQVSPANAYKYFSSKSALIAAIYLDLLQRVPSQADVDVDVDVAQRVIVTMRDIALVTAERPELAAACAAAVVANESAVKPYRSAIADELTSRIAAALGPGWPPDVDTALWLTLSGALVAERFQPLGQVARYLENAVHLVLRASEHR